MSRGLKGGGEQGVEALGRDPPPGRQPRHPPEPLAQLPALVERGPEAYGFRGQGWTCRRVAAVLRRSLGGTSPPAPGHRLLPAVRPRGQRPRPPAAPPEAGAPAALGPRRWPAPG